MKGLFFRNFVNNWLTKFESLPKSQALDCNYRNNTKKWAFCVVPRTGQKLHSHFFSPIDFIGGKQWISFGKTSSDPPRKKNTNFKVVFFELFFAKIHSCPVVQAVKWYQPDFLSSPSVSHTPISDITHLASSCCFHVHICFLFRLAVRMMVCCFALEKRTKYCYVKSRRRSFACRRTETFQEKKSAKTQKVC